MTADTNTEKLDDSPNHEGDVVEKFSRLVAAIKEGLSNGGLSSEIFEVTSLDESDLGERTQVLPDGVSVVKVGDDTLQSKQIVSINLSTLARSVDDAADISLGALFARSAEALNLDPDQVAMLQRIVDRKQFDAKQKEEIDQLQKDTGYSRGDWKEWGEPSVSVVKTTKKDGTVLMGAILGATTTTHVRMGASQPGDSDRSGLHDQDDLWQDGKQDNHNVKIPLDASIEWIERLVGR